MTVYLINEIQKDLIITDKIKPVYAVISDDIFENRYFISNIVLGYDLVEGEYISVYDTEDPNDIATIQEKLNGIKTIITGGDNVEMLLR